MRKVYLMLAVLGAAILACTSTTGYEPPAGEDRFEFCIAYGETIFFETNQSVFGPRDFYISGNMSISIEDAEDKDTEIAWISKNGELIIGVELFLREGHNLLNLPMCTD